VTKEFTTIYIDGRALRVVCDGAGTPTVVIDQGQGLSIERSFSQGHPIGWAKVFSEIQSVTRVFMHDRAGLGGSDAASNARSSLDMVDDLRLALRDTQVSPPYILVGHSVGGFNVRVFANRYPDEVAGIVLVDAAHPDQVARFSEVLPPESGGESQVLRAFRRGPDPNASAEGIDLLRCAEQARDLRMLRTPLMVVSQSPRNLLPGLPRELSETLQHVWSELQTDLLGLSADSTHIIATHAGHHIQLDEPQLVIDCILKMLSKARTAKAALH
jgi:pimeloyl-ACP methyl ester carboxylesterase